jgi:transposase
MCDALSRNVPKLATGVEILLANSLAHGRRQFVEVAANFPDQCRYVLGMLGQVYGHEAETRERGLRPEERLQFHQERSGPVMEQLHHWLEAQFAERKTEPNSGLGKAITYLLRHWRPLTLFLRQAGAPLDNNLVERALKRAVLDRKNALFYRTLNGAEVGDLFMSLIHTCQLCGANSFDYLTALQRHAQELAARGVDAVELSRDAGADRIPMKKPKKDPVREDRVYNVSLSSRTLAETSRILGRVHSCAARCGRVRNRCGHCLRDQVTPLNRWHSPPASFLMSLVRFW